MTMTRLYLVVLAVVYCICGFDALADNGCVQRCASDRETCKREGILLPSICTQIFSSCVDLCSDTPGLPTTESVLTVRKVLVPDSDPGKFNLLVDGIIEGSNIGHFESTDDLLLPDGTHVVSETNNSGTSLGNYISKICGSCRTNGSINLHGGDEASCVITNLKPTYSISDCNRFCRSRHKECLNDPDPEITNKFCAKLLRACEKSCVSAPINRLGVSRYIDVALTEEYTDRVLSGASSALRVSRSADDVACDIALCRDGPVTSFNIGDGIVDSGFELLEIMDRPGSVKVVPVLDICFHDFDPSITGCAETPGDSFIVELTTVDFLDIVAWAHEYGHNKGLCHRCPKSTTLMCGELALGTQTEINREECNVFEGKIRPMEQCPPSPDSSAAKYPIGIREFVQKLYIHGIAPELASARYSEKDVPILFEILADKQNKQYWVNTVVTLGLLGSEPAVDYLIDFIRKGTGKVISIEEFRAKIAAVTALGYLVNRTGSRKALNFLKKGTNPGTWKKLSIKWRSVKGSHIDVSRILSRYAIIGLGLSGNEVALDVLKRLSDTTKKYPDQLFHAKAHDLVIDAIKTNQRISDIGILKYYMY